MGDLWLGIWQAWVLVASADADLIEISLRSLQVTLTALVLASCLAFPLAALLTVRRFRSRRLVIAVLNALMGLPPVVVGLLVYVLLSRAGPFGVLGLLFTPTAMIIAQVTIIVPLIASVAHQSLRDLWHDYHDLLISLNVTQWQKMRTLLWDARRALLTAALAGFGRAMGEVGAIMIVGGNIDHATRVLTTAIALETGLPILAVPTTYAGSEMTNIWGLTEGRRKTTGRDPRVLPRTVIYDPELTVSLPLDIAVASGMNAIAHLVEGLYAPGISPVMALQAEEGIRALASALPRLAANPGDLTARGDALYGAWLAGWTLGTTGMGIHHKICHTLGGTYNLPHAPSHSAVIAYATDFNAGHAPAAMAAITRALNAGGIPCDNPAQGIWDLADRIGAPLSLQALGFELGSIDEATAIVVDAQPTNPRPVESDGVRALLIAAYEGTRPGALVSTEALSG